VQKKLSNEQRFIRHLRGRSEPGDLARMRRTLGDPGLEVIPVVEGFIGRIQAERENSWERMMFYLVAGLWASTVSSSELKQFHQEPEEESEITEPDENKIKAGYRRKLGHTIAQLYLSRDQSTSIEQRFIALLDADEEQLPYRMRQMVQLLKAEKGIRIYWIDLLHDLLAWNREGKYVQQIWAKAFYRTVSREADQGEEE
jgi:CRISPR system Cascade subunit CasB